MKNLNYVISVLALCSLGLAGCPGFFGKTNSTQSSSSTNTTNIASNLLPTEYSGDWAYITVANNADQTLKAARIDWVKLQSQLLSTYRYTYLSGTSIQGEVNGAVYFDSSLNDIYFSIIAGVDPLGGLIGNTLKLTNATLYPGVLVYGDSGSRSVFFKVPAGAQLDSRVYGSWNLQGSFGIDYLVLSQSGLGIAQLDDGSGQKTVVDFKYNSNSLTGILSIQFFYANPDDVYSAMELQYTVSEDNKSLSVLDNTGTSATGLRL